MIRPARRVPDWRRAAATAAAAALIWGATAADAPAQPAGTMNPSAFAAELQRLETLISSGAPGAVPAVQVPPVWTVDVDGQRFEMPALWLRHALDTSRRNPALWPARRAQVLGQLAALRLEAESLTASPDPGDRAVPGDRAGAALRSVLAGPEFRRMAQEGAFARIRQRLSNWLVRLWEQLGGGRLGRRGTAIVFAWLAAILAFLVLTMALVRYILRPANDAHLSLTAPAVRYRSARAWARDALKTADPRESVRCGYRAAVRALEEEGAWRPDETRTPREYLRLLPGEHRRRSLLADVTRRFEEVWYGAREATEEDRRSLLVRLKELGCLPAD